MIGARKVLFTYSTPAYFCPLSSPLGGAIKRAPFLWQKCGSGDQIELASVKHAFSWALILFS
jgi:hypothetical protein